MCQPSNMKKCQQHENKDPVHEDNDERFTLTAEEKEAVRALKEAADAEGLYYKDVFELVKYVLVVRSLEKKAEKRLEVSLRRLRNRHEWMKRHHLWDVDALEAHAEIASASKHFVQPFERDVKDGRTVVAMHMAHVPMSYIHGSDAALSKYLAAAMLRMQLGAVDLAEARKGLALCAVCERDLTFGRALKFVKFMKRTSSHFQYMHPHTVKAVYAQVPGIVAHLVPVVKAVLPAKVADRIHVYSSVKEMGKYLESFSESSSDEEENSSDSSNFSMTPQEWARQRYERYQETVAKISLD